MLKLIIIFNALFNLACLTSSLAHESEFKSDLTKEQLSKILPSDHVLGNLNAPVTVIEYSSLSCPHCAYFHQHVFEDFKKQYLDTGKVVYAHRDFPIDAPSFKGAILVNCVPAAQHYTYLKVLFEKQESWAYQKNFPEILENIAKLGGMTGEGFQACFNNKEIEQKVLDSRMHAMKVLNLNATPVFLINGKAHNGALRLNALEKAIEQANSQSVNIK